MLSAAPSRRSEGVMRYVLGILLWPTDVAVTVMLWAGLVALVAWEVLR